MECNIIILVCKRCLLRCDKEGENRAGPPISILWSAARLWRDLSAPADKTLLTSVAILARDWSPRSQHFDIDPILHMFLQVQTNNFDAFYWIPVMDVSALRWLRRSGGGESCEQSGSRELQPPNFPILPVLSWHVRQSSRPVQQNCKNYLLSSLNL